MKYKSYSNYKDSGVEWLGEIPIHWNIKKLKHLSDIQTGTTPSTTDESNFDDNEGIPWIKPDELNGFSPLISSKKYLTTKGLKSARLIKKNSVLVCGIGSIGKFGFAGEDLTTNQQINSITFNKLLLPSFGKFLISSSEREMDKFANGNVVKILNTESQKNIYYPYLGLQEQQKIADFLDKATSKIDKTIEKQTKLCELLKEKRQAVISHAVTKGLDSNIPMKDSGVEWLGEIPEHWDRSKLGFETTVKARLGWKGLKAEEYVEDGYIFLATPNIKDNEIDFKNVNYITEERYKESPEIMLKEGDVLVTKDGSTTGTTNVVRYLPKEATVNSSIAVIRPKINLNSLYLYYYFVGSYIQETIELMKGGMGVPHLFQADLRWFNILLPSLKEQQEIGIYLDKTTFKIDTLIEKSNKAIALLKEKRTALISSAVTGKIDIRDLV